jgi:hypothetical protein
VRAAANAGQGEARSRRTVGSVGIGLAERKRRFFVIVSMAVIAAEERGSYSFDRVEDAIAIALIRRNPVIVAHGVGGDRKEDGVLPRRALVAHAIAPSANAIFDRQRIKAEPAVGIADERDIAGSTPMRAARSAAAPVSMPEAADIATGMHDLLIMHSPFGPRGRLCGRVWRKCEDRYDCENPCLPALAHCHYPESLALQKQSPTENG